MIKRFWVLLPAFLLIAPGAEAYSTFYETYNGPGDVSISYVEPLANGHFLFTAYSSEGTPPGDTWIGEIDEGGELLWDKLVLKAPRGLAIIPGQGCLVLAGYGAGGELIRLDMSGNEVWSQDVNSQSRGIQRTEDGNYVYASGDSLYKIDADGNQIWSAEVPSTFDEIMTVGPAASPAGGFTATGRKSPSSPNTSITGLFDNDGNLLWHGERHIFMTLDYFGGSYSDPDGNCYSSFGWGSSYPPPTDEYYAFRFDSGGELAWQLALDGASYICPSPEYNVVIAGRKVVNYELMMSIGCVNGETGSSIWNVTHDYAVTPTCIRQVPQGGYIIGAGTGNHAVLIRTDSLGLIDGMGIAQSESDLIFGVPTPNPATVSASIPFTLGNTGTVTMQVFDLTGRTVATLGAEEFAAGQHTLNWNLTDSSGAAVPRGVYSIVVTTGETVMAERVMVLR